MQCAADGDCGWNAFCGDNGLCKAHPLGYNLVLDGVMGVMSFVIAGVSLAAGVGGGGLFVPLAMIVLSMDSRVATALSQSMLVGGAIAAFAYNFSHHHPQAPRRPLVDFELACLLGPALMAGAQVGGIIHAMAPPALLLALLCFVLSDAARKGVQNALKIAKKVAEEQEKDQAGAGGVKALKMVEEVEAAEMVGDGAKSGLEEDSLTDSRDEEANARIFDAQWKLAVVWAFCIIIDVAKGVMVDICSNQWWVLVSSCVVCLAGFALYYANELSQRAPVDEASLDFRELAFPLVRWSLFAGVLAAVCGIGGGMVMGPILVGLNVPPPISAATTATTLLVLASSIDAVYLVRAQAPLDYSLFLCAMTSVGALTGKIIIGRWVARTGKHHVIVWCLAGITLVSVLLMGSLGVFKVVKQGTHAFEFSDMCKVHARKYLSHHSLHHRHHHADDDDHSNHIVVAHSRRLLSLLFEN